MLEIFTTKLMPIILYFLIGYSLKRFGVLKKEEAGVLIRLVFYLMSPAVIITSMSSMKFSETLIYYPISAICIHIFMYFLTLIIANKLKISDKEKVIFRGSTLIMNMTFVLPFFIVFFGEENVYLLSLFDAGNLLMVTTVVYSIFITNSGSLLNKIKTVLKSPLIISMIIGALLNITGIRLPKGVEITIQNIASITGTVIMIALGAYFTPKFSKLKLSVIVILVKMLGVLFIGTILGKVLPIDEMGKMLILLGAMSPVGNNVLSYALITDGDVEMATNVISLSNIVSFIAISVLLLIV
ncbi:AEC family transporter [uncultured Fusobacterium sp.]|uniref:AEC family transporter n=1 Tax=uncultured Fusobacterium sp. TaxID=159267 RepID=UPI0026026FCF|nr:AEC family transporter [uncultured Fusobacterium sp.]